MPEVLPKSQSIKEMLSGLLLYIKGAWSWFADGSVGLRQVQASMT